MKVYTEMVGGEHKTKVGMIVIWVSVCQSYWQIESNLVRDPATWKREGKGGRR